MKKNENKKKNKNAKKSRSEKATDEGVEYLCYNWDCGFGCGV